MSKRPQDLNGFTRKVVTGCGNLYVTVNSNDGKPVEVFATLGKQGGCQASLLEASARLISETLSNGVNVKDVIKQLEGIRCPCPIMFPEEARVLSCSDAVAKVLREAPKEHSEGS